MRWPAILCVGLLGLALAGCGSPTGQPQVRELSGAVILNDPAVERTDTDCVGTGKYADLRPGLAVTARNEGGGVVGSGALLFNTAGIEGQCVYTWKMTVTEATSYAITVGERAAGVFTIADLNQRSWGVAVTFQD